MVIILQFFNSPFFLTKIVMVIILIHFFFLVYYLSLEKLSGCIIKHRVIFSIRALTYDELSFGHLFLTHNHNDYDINLFRQDSTGQLLVPQFDGE